MESAENYITREIHDLYYTPSIIRPNNSNWMKGRGFWLYGEEEKHIQRFGEET
jgi:hypothetical protein